MEKHFWPLVCPVCEAALTRIDNMLKCVQLHSFDMATKGYVNLSLGNRQTHRLCGDAREMLAARKTFLGQGFYQPLSDALNMQVYQRFLELARHKVKPGLTCIAEVGCGEGYYLGRLKDYLDRRLGTERMCYFGMDIAKEAVRLAARQHNDIFFFVADVKRKILFSKGSVRILLNIFSPRNAVEFDRVLASEGLLFVVIPNPDHLTSLRSEFGLLAIEANKRQHIVEQLSGVFRLAKQQSIKYDLYLNGKELSDLIRMTPNYWHLPSETWSSLEAREDIRTSASFTILEFKKHAVQAIRRTTRARAREARG